MSGRSRGGTAAFVALVSAVAALSALAGFWLHQNLTAPPPPSRPAVPQVTLGGAPPPPDPSLPRPRPAFSLPDVNGRMHAVSEWDGRLLVINFWATWCQPCLAEIPMLMKLQHRYAARGMQLLGVAVDQPGPVRAFTKKVALDYPTLIGEDVSLQLMRAYGNDAGTLPFTAIVSRKGQLVYTHNGALSAEEAGKTIERYLGS